MFLHRPTQLGVWNFKWKELELIRCHWPQSAMVLIVFIVSYFWTTEGKRSIFCERLTHPSSSLSCFWTAVSCSNWQNVNASVRLNYLYRGLCYSQQDNNSCGSTRKSEKGLPFKSTAALSFFLFVWGAFFKKGISLWSLILGPHSWSPNLAQP